MFLFGHLGIGSKLVSPFSRGLSQRHVLLGTILPDIIDKPLYYGFSFYTGGHGAALGLISGTRTLGHTALFLLVLSLGAFFKRSRALAALSLGTASHLILDSWGDYFLRNGSVEQIQSALLWPFTGLLFPASPYSGLKEHLGIWIQPFILWGEVVGLILLAIQWSSFRKETRK